MDKTVGAVSAAAIITTGVAAWALYKFLETRQKLKQYVAKYDDAREVQRQLVHHYGDLKDLPLLKEVIPPEAEGYHSRLSHFCSEVCQRHGVPRGRVLDVGCGPGGLSFHLSSHFQKVVGTDISYPMIAAGQQLKQFAEFGAPFSSEGGNHISFIRVRVPDSAVRERVVFWDEDASALFYTSGKFNCIIVSNTITDMEDPKTFLETIANYTETNGVLIISDVYNWLNGPEELLGGEGECLTWSTVNKILEKEWTYEEETNIPFYVPRCKRLALVGNTHVSVWKRKPEEI
ncbi:uncharacterized protein LOC126995475 [Eriocheir sinensis]|uniref:uncharacterized protein LOC126995475 n=1 Tax=Eriocheir sinensis TaxID=95602 RepID=UPI0021C9264F|nr:uncharacterized protein LOC126995475 [Eriocheir sinensis]XP_050711012.1 uncharacterized protein LOC126995475 [Eriocheir sinensis]